MKNPIQAMFEAGVVERTDFPPESRYHGVPLRVVTGADGVPTSYLARRFPPSPDGFHIQRFRRVGQGERLDQIAASEIGDPEAFWMLCDAAGAIWAEELEVTGSDVPIALPQGVPGPQEE